MTMGIFSAKIVGHLASGVDEDIKCFTNKWHRCILTHFSYFISSPKVDQTLPEVARTSPKVAHTLGEVWENLGEVQATLGKVQATLGEVWTNLHI